MGDFTGTHRAKLIDDNMSTIGSPTNALRTDPIGSTTQPVSFSTAASGGATPYKYLAAASANQDSQSVKASPGNLFMVAAFCTQATLRYLKIYDKATAPTSADTPKFTFLVPGNASGAGFVVALTCGFTFASGIAFRLTTGIADNDANAVTANDVVVDLAYT